jgi:hypothetical protein
MNGVHDTLEVFGGRVPELGESWRNTIAPKLNRRVINTVSNASEVLFGALSNDLRRAAEISAERALSAELIRETCQYGFREVFG